MRKKIVKDSTFCDNCKKEAYVQACLSCGVEHCFECQKKCGTEYSHSALFSGSGDGYFCRQCDGAPNEHAKAIHAGYRDIAMLRVEHDKFYEDFKQRAERAENLLKEIQKG